MQFRDYIILSEELQSPLIITSTLVDDFLNGIDKSIADTLRSKIEDFKKQKTMKPTDMAHGFHDHKLSNVLRSYYDAHLIHGRVLLIYYHGGEYIILLNIVNHKQIDPPNNTKLGKKLDSILPKYKELAQKELLVIQEKSKKKKK